MKILTLAVLVTVTMALSSCNTIAGMGEDMQKGGRAIHDAAS